ncbi:MAG: hypothetical protein EU550_03920, partial [Promethearchaeota archaeon]
MNDHGELKTIKKKSFLIVFILFLAFVALNMINFMDALDQENKYIVPLFNLEQDMHYLVLFVFWPILTTLIAVILFPLILIPVVMFIKNRIWHKYQNGYIEMGPLQLDLKVFFKRSVYIFLLGWGLSSTLVSLGVFDVNLFIPTTIDANTELAQRAYEENLLYYPEFFIGITSLILPLVIGLLSISWTLEDVGLMHYKFPDEAKNEKFLYEIEPVYLKYHGIIKGYAGIAGILYLISAIIFHITYNTDQL